MEGEGGEERRREGRVRAGVCIGRGEGFRCVDEAADWC